MNTAVYEDLAEELMKNLTVREFLEMQMGPQHISFVVVLPITILYLLIFVSGVIGNIVVCLVISRNSHFHTPTNYYLFSLAISDLFILVFGLPYDLKVYWQQYPWMLGETVCRLRAYMAETTSYASVLTIVAFTVERYVAICHPLFMQTISTLPRAIKLIISVWVVSCICATPFATYTKINYMEFPTGSGNVVQQSAFCALPMENQQINQILLQCSTFLFFCLPMTIIIILYVKIYLKLRNSRFVEVSSKDNSRHTTRRSSTDCRKAMVRRSVSKMLVAVVIAFFVCWAPFHGQRLLAVYVDADSWTVALRTTNEILYYAGGCLYYFSATINPILYTLMSVKYREAFKDTLCHNGQKRHCDHSHFRCTRHHSDHSCPSMDKDLSSRKPSFAFTNRSEKMLYPNEERHQTGNEECSVSDIIAFKELIKHESNQHTKEIPDEHRAKNYHFIMLDNLHKNGILNSIRKGGPKRENRTEVTNFIEYTKQGLSTQN